MLDQLKNTTIRENELTASNNDLEKNSIQEAEHLGHLIVKRESWELRELEEKMAEESRKKNNIERKITCNGHDTYWEKEGPCRKSFGDSWQKEFWDDCKRCLRNNRSNPECEQRLIDSGLLSREKKKRRTNQKRIPRKERKKKKKKEMDLKQAKNA